MRYKAYLFDVQGTLLDFFEPVSRAVAEHSPDVDAAAFTRAWRADYFARVSNLTQSAGHWTRVQDLYAAGFADVCQTFGLPCPDTATAEDVASSWQRLVPWPDVPAGLAALRLRAVVATLSNTDMATMVNLFKRLDISWDAIFTAEIFGRFKPDPSVYRGALRYLGVEPREAAMVAAHPYDLRAARQLGMGTIFVSRPHEYGDPALAHTDPDEEFDQRVTAIGELS
ncbi:haloacid dehalogenase type II [Mycobacteroides abscessus]|uniref:haloacid dehalogenase type II n=1 Tax=Mycobacteroides abscessus TaxID=36809 RepID=UPI0009A71550|nr:haloacid dehalogenase type II [Mycobacteroides abscessus]SKF64740.1 haloacid dehalogenase, type II [Mycobacteroides abscessus subsp. bolletii]SKF64894.1 haloacid dehalogenase, type II [Mycobacteroides abscessus subsp. bolletii]SKF88049.1 haloacid dehalogenase, type II [Mycobacteroides abscessus subsp. bolletii]SKG58053.1 haloacid dehalogenase, type II [Mycobacteroides abscessus subsp. bolletii]SKG70771.1 haloacid dehalogenase, type II [Mycobacteroides abscessus subsp. bolletii]